MRPCDNTTHIITFCDPYFAERINHHAFCIKWECTNPLLHPWNETRVPKPLAAYILHVAEQEELCPQIENGYGMCGSDPAYQQALVKLIKDGLGNETIIYTSALPPLPITGSISGAELYTCDQTSPNRLLSNNNLRTRRTNRQIRP